MKLPSLDLILTKLRTTLLRFPFVLASAALASFIAIYLAGLSYPQAEEADYLYRMILVAVLGIPLFITLPLIGEQHGWSRLTIALANTAGAALLLIYYFLLPADLDAAPYKHLLRYMLYFLFLHLLIAIGPYVNKDGMNGFWQYNKTLFLRFLTAILFSGVLFIGLTVALGSINVLLDIEIADERYLQLFLLIAGIFNTWFFLAGIPPQLDQLEYEDAYPKGLKVFTQYILIPLVTVYLVILYLYMGKIIFEWNWPEGWVAYLVLSFSIVGILALLLLHPIREHVENQWIKRFSRSYFLALVPLVILLLLAIWVRIDEYSITVNRYFVLVLGLWLAGIVCYFILSKTQNIKAIPASLGIVALLISFGPWGAFSTAERSQTNRLQYYLQEHEILQQGIIHPASDTLPFEDRREISSILRYLNNTHGLDGIQPWFEQDLDNFSVKEGDSTRVLARYERPSKIAELMGVEYTLSHHQPHDVSNRTIRNFNTEPQRLIAIQPYDWLAQDIQIYPHQQTDSLQIGNQTFFLSLSNDSSSLQLSLGDESQQGLTIPVESLAKSLFQKSSDERYGLPAEEMSVEASNGQWQTKVYFRNLSLKETEDTPRIESAQMDLLLKFNANDQ